MKTRVISGVVLVAILVASLVLGGPVLAAALLFCSLTGMYEMMKALGAVTEEKPFPPAAVAGYAGAVFYYVLIFFTGDLYFGEAAAVIVITIMAFYVVTFPGCRSSQAIDVCFSFIYVAFMLSFIYLIRAGANGIIYVWLVFGSSWAADTCAYFAGVRFGRHKMTPVLSPKKTWEGAVGGVLGAALIATIFALILDPSRNWLPYTLTCAVGSVISIFGDLAVSAIKREKGIKDYGTLIPGHGGIMDRFDSVIFTAPGIYFLIRVFLTAGVLR